jgi:hypothetical protein
MRCGTYGLGQFITDTAWSAVSLSQEAAGHMTNVLIIGRATVAGIGQVRSFRLELFCSLPVAFALVYFPEGVEPAVVQSNEFQPSVATSL